MTLGQAATLAAIVALAGLSIAQAALHCRYVFVDGKTVLVCEQEEAALR